ncbi:2811_t:CDS:2, partial [Racocetra fulgida]
TSNDEDDSSQEINEDDYDGISSENQLYEIEKNQNFTSTFELFRSIIHLVQYGSAFDDLRIWMLPTVRNAADIYFEKISENVSATIIEKATLRYGASNIIDLSAHIKSWFSSNDKRFMMKYYEFILRISELALKKKTFEDFTVNFHLGIEFAT